MTSVSGKLVFDSIRNFFVQIINERITIYAYL
jgi:hypothetical protein